MRTLPTPGCKCSHVPAPAGISSQSQQANSQNGHAGLRRRQQRSARPEGLLSRSSVKQQHAMQPCASAPAMADTSRADDSGAAQQDTLQADSSSAAAQAPDAAQAADWIEVGLIRSVHGLRGEVKVEPLTDSPAERLGTAGSRWLQQPEVPGRRRQNLPPPTEVSIAAGRSIVSKGRKVWLVKLAGTDSPEAADALRGCKLLIRPTDRPALEDEDEFYAQDLVGMTVVQQGSEAAIGKVVDIYDGTGTHDVLRILLGAEDPEAARTVLVPFHRSIVPHVDAGARRLTIDPPAGLFDIAVPARRMHRNPRNKQPKL